MRIIDGIKDGLVIVIDWTSNENTNYQGFDGKSVWPNAEWQSEDSDTSRSLSRINPERFQSININPIIIKNGLGSVNNLEDVIKYKSTLSDLNRLLYLKFSNYSSPNLSIINKMFSFLGYDYGNYISEDNYYSFIYHEVINIHKNNFDKFKKYLNKNLLFSSLAPIVDLEKEIVKLKANGEKLETYIKGEEFQAIAIYAFNELN